jgi:hypothetical protein
MYRLFFVNPLHIGVMADNKPANFLVAPYGKIPLRYNAGADGRGMNDMEDNESGPWLDYDRVRTCLSHIPSYRNLTLMASAAMDEQSTQLYDDLLDCDPLLPSLLTWILTATSHQLRPLTSSEQFAEMGTPLQFAVTPCDTQREEAFQALKRQAGIDRNTATTSTTTSTPSTTTDNATSSTTTRMIPSTVWGFHGSDTSNWHSILRTGLKMMSHTAWANSAPVYGPGIYLSVSSRIAMNYAKFAGGWTRSSLGSTIRIGALCEVINHPLLREPAPFYVIPHAVRDVHATI